MTLSVLVPSSIGRETDGKRDATRKLGTIARAAVIFRADRVVVFPDREGERQYDGGFVETVLRYAATPPYLRKELWGTRDELEYAGVLPPLQASSRTGSGSSDPGSTRQGIVTEVGPDGRVRVNCGLQHPISLPVPDDRELAQGERVTVRISSRRPVRAKLVDESPPGFAVERADLHAALDRDDAGIRIATSRHGDALTTSGLGPLVRRIQRDGATVAFGAPQRGLPEMLGVAVTAITNTTTDAPTGFDRWLNTIPNQGSETVRTEEAVLASLATLTLTE